jgi:histidinol-phosphate aminotransferase
MQKIRRQRIKRWATMKDDNMNFFRSDIMAMTGYTPGEQPQVGSCIKLNTNENPYPASSQIAAAVAEDLEKARFYSDPVCMEVRKAAAKVYGLTPEQVIVGNGSDDILNILIRATTQPGEVVASFSPSYSLYETLAELQGATFRKIEFTEDYAVPEELDLAGVRILFLVNPNAPSGTMVSHDVIRRVCAACPGIVVVDEAYADFATENAIGLLSEIDNLVVSRTFSKSYSLAGLRIGLGLASPAIIEQLMKVKDSYNVNRLSQVAAVAALEDQDALQAHTEAIVATRERTRKALEEMGLFIYPSQTNFLLVRFAAKPAAQIYDELKARNILVRYFSKPRLDDCLRISIGTDEEMDQVLAALREILA